MELATTRIAALSSRADFILEQNHDLFFKLRLAVTFYQSRLRIKYWLPLPGFDGNTSDEQLLLGNLVEGNDCLKLIDTEIGLSDLADGPENAMTKSGHDK